MNNRPLLRACTFCAIVAFLACTLVGCSTQLALNSPKPTAPPMAAAQKESLTVVRFTDARKTKNLLTMVGAIGFGTPKLTKPNAAGDWVAMALASDLEHAGAHVAVVTNASTAQTPVVVTGRVSKIFTHIYSPAMFLRCDVDFSVVVHRNGMVVLQKNYQGVASSAYFGGPGAAQDIDAAMTKALKRALLLATPEVIRASQ